MHLNLNIPWPHNLHSKRIIISDVQVQKDIEVVDQHVCFVIVLSYSISSGLLFWIGVLVDGSPGANKVCPSAKIEQLTINYKSHQFETKI